MLTASQNEQVDSGTGGAGNQNAKKDERRDQTLIVRVTAEEKKKIIERASIPRSGKKMSVSTYVRFMLGLN